MLNLHEAPTIKGNEIYLIHENKLNTPDSSHNQGLDVDVKNLLNAGSLFNVTSGNLWKDGPMRKPSTSTGNVCRFSAETDETDVGWS